MPCLALGTFSALIGSTIAMIVLLIAASVLSWSETGQLLANTLTVIIKGFLLVFLRFFTSIWQPEHGHPVCYGLYYKP